MNRPTWTIIERKLALKQMAPSLAAQCHIVVADDLCVFFIDKLHRLGKEAMMDSLPVRPPYPKTWLEGVTSEPDQRWAAHVEEMPISEVPRAMVSMLTKHGMSTRIASERAARIPDGKWALHIHLFGSLGNAAPQTIGQSVLIADKSWRIHELSDILHFSLNLNEVQRDVYVRTVMMAIGCLKLLHVKGAKTARFGTRQQARARERLYKGLIINELVVRPLRDRTDSLGHGGGSSPDLRSRHEVRAHEKEYVEERPLFGKRVGRFWWWSYWRCDSDNGTTLHDKMTVETSEAEVERWAQSQSGSS